MSGLCNAWKRFYSLTVFLITCQITACSQSEITEEKPESPAWWQDLTPDLVIGSDTFYVRSCAITQVKTSNGIASDHIIFEVPLDYLTSCDSGEHPLIYDGEYITLTVCKMAFATGGCSGGRYRSADFEHWQEDIGITWIKGEEYEAWRILGSTSSKADFVKKVEH